MPSLAAPMAVEIMPSSATPTSKNLSGNSFAKISVFVDLLRSASKTIMFSFFPSSASFFPNASLVEYFSFLLYIFIPPFFQKFFKLFQPFYIFFIRRRCAMPFRLVFHVFNPFSFCCVENYCRGLIVFFRLICNFKKSQNGFHVMPIQVHILVSFAPLNILAYHIPAK